MKENIKITAFVFSIMILGAITIMGLIVLGNKLFPNKPCVEKVMYRIDSTWGFSPLGDNLDEALKLANGKPIVKYTYCKDL